ncbi:hypothetical protein M569_16983, partial [Genlisea aurea]
NLFSDPERRSDGIFSVDPLLIYTSGSSQWFTGIVSLVNTSKHAYLRGALVLTEAFSCMSKFAGALVLWSSGGSTSDGKSWADYSNAATKLKRITSARHLLAGSFWKSNCCRKRNPIPLVIGRISSFTLKRIRKEAEWLQSLPLLSLAGLLTSPEPQRCMDRKPCKMENRGCALFENLASSKTVESITGVEFPTMLDNSMPGDDGDSTFMSEILVGTGSRTLKIIRIKSLKVYAFGFYVHPFDVCGKLGRKYSCIPDDELKGCRDFYRDLLREDISMTVRLVVNYDGVKINTVKEVFEKSLRARLATMNPEADLSCLQTFGSFFTRDIALHVVT